MNTFRREPQNYRSEDMYGSDECDCNLDLDVCVCITEAECLCNNGCECDECADMVDDGCACGGNCACGAYEPLEGFKDKYAVDMREYPDLFKDFVPEWEICAAT